MLESTLSRVAAERSSNREEPGQVLVALVSARIIEGSRKGSAVITEAGLRSFVFTESFIQTLPGALQRKCLALRLEGCPKCLMKGFALDVWSAGFSLPAQTALISVAQDFLEIFPTSLTPLHAHADDCRAHSTRPVLTLIELQVR